jgi:hypothetical protein
MTQHSNEVMGILHGFDRLRLQGSLRYLYKPSVMDYYLQQAHVLYKDFKTFATGLTRRIYHAAESFAHAAGRPMIYLRSSRLSKEDLARERAEKDQIREGLIAVFGCVEPCRTYFLRGNRDTGRLELKLQSGKCLHLYFYQMHPEVGFMHLRLQTWFPFLIHICLNGREWLARQMGRAGLAYRRQDNGFPWIADVGLAQRFMDSQPRTNWPAFCNALVRQCHPLHEEIGRPMSLPYYWTAAESEFASDVMFRDRASLQQVYPALVHHAVKSFGSTEVMRFLGRRPSDRFEGQVVTDVRRRTEGVRVKHRLNDNSLKLYDKGSVLRSEVTMNDPREFRVYRASEGDPKGDKSWRILRRSVADMGRRVEVSRAANERYLTALAAVSVGRPLAAEATGVCRARTRDGRRYRALNPFAEEDAALLSLVNRGEWALRGFRNRELRQRLWKGPGTTAQEQRRSAAVTRKLALLRAHGLIAKVSRTHRWVVTKKGRRVISALLTARQADVEKLTALAA